jgi:predicted outer membrane lipoprotein
MTLGLGLNCGIAVGILENLALELVMKTEEYVIVTSVLRS